MKDIHCHILYGVDDGAGTKDDSLRMLDIAAAGGISEIVATPHYRGRWKNRERARENYAQLQPEAQARGIALALGAEFFWMEFDRDHIERYVSEMTLGDSREFLFELDRHTEFSQVEESIYMLQQAGLSVLIAHPERNVPIQREKQAAKQYLDSCCGFVMSSDALAFWRLSSIYKTAMREYKRGNYTYIASDAHSPSDYERHIKLLAKFRV